MCSTVESAWQTVSLLFLIVNAIVNDTCVKGGWLRLLSRLREKHMLVSVVFYGLVGLAFLVWTPFSGYPPHLVLLGILSLFVAYGVYKGRSWAAWLIVGLFFAYTTFVLVTLYYALYIDLALSFVVVVFMVMSWIVAGYALEKRRYWSS